MGLFNVNPRTASQNEIGEIISPKASQIISIPIAEDINMDAFVDSDFPAQNFGLEESLIVENSTGTKIVYFYFNFSAKPAEFYNAELCFYRINTSETILLSVWLVQSEWDEATICYENRPSLVELIGSYEMGKFVDTFLCNLTDIIGDRTSLSLALTIPSQTSNTCEIVSKDSAEGYDIFRPTLVWSCNRLFSITSPSYRSSVMPNNPLYIQWEYLGPPLGELKIDFWGTDGEWDHTTDEYFMDYIAPICSINYDAGNYSTDSDFLSNYIDDYRYFLIKIQIGNSPGIIVESGIFQVYYEYYGYYHIDYLFGPIFLFILCIVVVLVMCIVRLGSKNRKIKELEAKLGLAPSNAPESTKNYISKEKTPDALDSRYDVNPKIIQKHFYQFEKPAIVELFLMHGAKTAFGMLQDRLREQGVQDPWLLQQETLRQINAALYEYGFFLS